MYEYCFFFFKQKTAYEMRISDWSSDVCSSDLFLHVITKKGQGYKLAEADPVLYHGPGKFDLDIGIQKPATPPKQTFTKVFGNWLCDMALADSRLVGITPAMREGSGLEIGGAHV